MGDLPVKREYPPRRSILLEILRKARKVTIHRCRRMHLVNDRAAFRLGERLDGHGGVLPMLRRFKGRFRFARIGDATDDDLDVRRELGGFRGRDACRRSPNGSQAKSGNDSPSLSRCGRLRRS